MTDPAGTAKKKNYYHTSNMENSVVKLFVVHSKFYFVHLKFYVNACRTVEEYIGAALTKLGSAHDRGLEGHQFGSVQD